MNSCLENSHIVAAFMCHETTSCNKDKKAESPEVSAKWITYAIEYQQYEN